MKLTTMVVATTLVLVGATAAQAAPGDPVDPTVEIPTFAKIYERYQNIVATPGFQQELVVRSAEGAAAKAALQVYDPERNPANVCAVRAFECAGDVRFYDWDVDGHGISTPVVFTARSGATLSGTVWATRAGPAKRPLVVITTGSVQAPEVLYWRQAATLAKHGYVVLTYDTQGQGLSDTLGEGADALESVPAQGGQPFYDGTEDALDFALSRPGAPYEPRPSCSSGTSHAAKQDRRVAAGLNSAYNPLFGLVDATRVGIAGHSLGASAVSYVGQEDPRVKAIVAWDNLSAPTGAPACGSAPGTRTDRAVTKPALGISNDYGITPMPNLQVPDPSGKTAAFDAYRTAGVDSGELVIRGGCHEESAFIPAAVTTPVGPLGCGSLRGNDLLAWYTTAWFDKYVKGDATADRRLLTDRWRDDRLGGEADLLGDTNVLSRYFLSTLDIERSGGGRAVCDDVRAGCAVLSSDGQPADYGIDSDALTPDAAGPGLGADTDGDGVRDGADTCPSVAGPADNRGCAPEEAGTPGGPDDAACTVVRRGTDRADRLRGTGRGDRLLGRAGNDTISGRGGADCLLGQAGAGPPHGRERSRPAARRTRRRRAGLARRRRGPGQLWPREGPGGRGPQGPRRLVLREGAAPPRSLRTLRRAGAGRAGAPGRRGRSARRGRRRSRPSRCCRASHR